MQSRNNLRVAHPLQLVRSVGQVHPLFFIGFLSLFFLGIPFTHASKEYEAAHPGKKVYYFLNDHLGSVDKVLDSDGNIVEERDFLPYGEERVSESYSGNKAKDITDHKFTGKELDDETGLYYYGARYYDPLIGRFISQDPWEGSLMSPQTLNKYSYVVNNPVRYVDPTGKKLKVSGSEEFIKKTLDDLKIISPYVSLQEDHSIGFSLLPFLTDLLNGEVKNPKGTSLLGSLIKDDNTATIENGDIYQTGVVEEERTFLNRFNLKNGKGVDVFLKNPNNTEALPVYDAEGEKVIYPQSPSYINLAHELSHAFQFLSGQVLKDAEIFYYGLNGQLYKANNNEVRTMGLEEKNDNIITENDIRKEHGEKERNNY